MRPQMADLFGLAIGFAIGGAALARYLPDIEAMLHPEPQPAQLVQPGPTQPGPTQPAPNPPIARPPVPHQVPPPDQIAALPAPVQMPQIVSPDLPPDGRGMPPLPTVIEPTMPSKSVGKAGTGFFIADDGSLLTAAHVVTGCRRTEILSRRIKTTPADVIATDPKQDIALLRARHVHPPGTLSLGRSSSHEMIVLGYPATAGPTIPEETTATLENDKFPRPYNAMTDPRDVVWIEAAAVTHGYSGGPILDLENGAVIGIVKGMVDTGRLQFVRGMPTSGVTIGPGVGRLTSFLHQAAPDLYMATAYDTGDTVLDDARRATVHVVCWF
jgi:S1-C subfamily serine protease